MVRSSRPRKSSAATPRSRWPTSTKRSRSPRAGRARARLRSGRRSTTAQAEDALVQVFREEAGRLTARLVRIIGNFDVAEEIVQDTLLVALEKWPEAGIPYRVPEGQDLDERVQEVLAVLYLMFNEGYLASTGKPVRRDLAEDAEWLAGLVVRLLPAEPEAIGLLVLMRLHLARADARLDAAGDLVLLRDQDRSRWKRDLIAGAIGLLEQAGAMRRPGPYQLQAAIAACHAEAASWEATDWPQILLLYDALVRLLPTPVVRLNRAVALQHVRGAADALVEVDALAGELAGYHLFHATRAELLIELGAAEKSRAASARAIELTTNPAERAVLERRLAELDA